MLSQSKLEQQLYLGINKVTKGSRTIFNMIVTSQVEALNSWAGDKSQPSTLQDSKSDSNIENKTIESIIPTGHESLKLLLMRLSETIDSSNALISTARIYPVLINEHIDSLLAKAKKDFNLIEENGTVSIFSIPETKSHLVKDLKSTVKEISDYKRVSNVLPEAIILSLVATFDSIISDILRYMFCSKPELINKDKNLTISEIFKMKSMEDVHTHLIEDEIDLIARKSREEQIKIIEHKFNISIIQSYDKWSQFIEITQRRNLVAHGNCIVNDYYIKSCAEANLKNIPAKGTKLRITSRYLYESSDLLCEFGILLIFMIWKKHYKEEISVLYSEISDITYNLISNKRHKLAVRILDYALKIQPFAGSDGIHKTMIINCANAHKNIGSEESIKRSKELIDSIDWSTTANMFKICVASLKGDIDAVVKFMPSIITDGSIKKESFRDWPVFAWVREDKKFISKFEELFAEPLLVGRAGIEPATKAL